MSEERPTPQHCGQPMAYWEWPEYYDGALFLVCDVCQGWRHRFREGHWLCERADRAVRGQCVDSAKEITVQEGAA